jgi:ribosomal protein L12E/L44/L45/RPP1/RPP2
MIDQKDACVLSTLFLHSTGKDISAANMQKMFAHLNVSVDAYLVDLFSKVDGASIRSAMCGAPSAAMSVPAASEAPKAEETKKEEEKEESDDFDLFG